MNNYNNDTNKFRKTQGGQRSNHRGSDNRGSDRRNSDRPRFGSQNSGPAQMHDAICADCGNNCKVPFMPSSGKPVYCSNCFEKRGNGDSNSRRPSFSPNKRSFSPPTARPQENYNKQFEIINSKLDKIFKLLNSNGQVTNESKVVTKKVLVEQVTPELISIPTEEVVEKIAPVKVAKKKAKAKKAPKAKVSESID
ncbi:MAG: hypothetical protein COZ34_01725 [Candidatus Pacebacteria bacterium CG_4_10_14_3_um_filter_34_15]|nr:hypothetical protein [Candidatus Pacearchaeota archaeon]NCQ65879.1 hypothetical protein [Candidatus Paceibacterota bacterium]OIO45269.1 MAG: hypothetical protein AUJ41_00390 [Candidatus Pacebacteria bacterium CG1_02_43_31]PIQ80656.1 MAG: hypothetical protein COV78_04370 [Candidatus Pacebacteria bacterium CG11_big_fil_rev_8_21_14_0_20_34_55]PIX81735.1 MAG: hypothetical protein COZ34_01725 [Candidatus Pacebacteria bacterium CG_4_10_14_3_um_filter_34_15]PJC43694.1 MAG: hypothetical protein CO0